MLVKVLNSNQTYSEIPYVNKYSVTGGGDYLGEVCKSLNYHVIVS